MDSTALKAAVAERNRAIAAFREAQDEEPRQRAWDAAEEQRAIIDEATVDAVTRLEAIEDAEARARAAFKESHPDPDPVWGSKESYNKAIRGLIDNPNQKLVLPYMEGRMPKLGETRTDYTMTTADTTAYGSYTIATLVWRDLVWHMNAQSGILQAGPTIIRTPGNQSITVPHVHTDATFAQVSEGSASTDSTYPVFAYTTLKAYRLSGHLTVTDEMLRTSEYPFMDVLNEVCNRELATRVAAQLALGAGSTYPDGLFIAATADCTAVNAAAATTFTMDELLSMFYTPVTGVRAVGSWIFTTPAMKLLCQLKDGEGRYLFQPSVVAGVPDRLWGRPVFEEAHGDASGTIAAEEEHVVFGDMSSFWVRFAGPTEIAASRENKFTEWETVIRAAVWMDCNIVDETAFVVLHQHA